MPDRFLRPGDTMHAEPAEERPSALRPVTSRPAGQIVADRLVTAIALGQFALGEKLPPERELSELLGVSRTTLRDAVGRLVEAGYVSVRRGRSGGIFVESTWGQQAESMIRRTLVADWERLEQLLDFRAIIEATVARTAAQRRTARDIDALRAALHAYLEADPSRPSSSAADARLHQAVAAATGSPHLVELSLRIRTDVTLGLGAEPWSPLLRARGVEQHPELVHAIIEGDAGRAASLASEHFSLTEHTLRDLLAAVGSRPSNHRSSVGPAAASKTRRGAHAYRRA
jgi:GntR family transcriptional repressor for pyruvate dehydrogenase complex